MSKHDDNKYLLTGLLSDLADAAPGRQSPILHRYCHPDIVWEFFHPFNTVRGIPAAQHLFWGPLTEAFPDLEFRADLALAGSYENHDFVSGLGHLTGSFHHEWIGIGPTHRPCSLRFGINAIVQGGRIVKAYIMFDILDVMRQAGEYPLRTMPGTAERWPAPPCDGQSDLLHHDGHLGSVTLDVVRAMQSGLGSGRSLPEHAAAVTHSPLWHQKMNWYGVAGIGSTRGQRGFDDYHGALFIQAFPDRTGYPRTGTTNQDAAGHYIQIGDGHFAVTGGWPSLHATHTGAGWLGMAATGTQVQMRVADWYRTDTHDLIVDNWVMIDTLHILAQMGEHPLNHR